MDTIQELRIYRLAFRIACERLSDATKSCETIMNEIYDQAKRLEAAVQNEVA